MFGLNARQLFIIALLVCVLFAGTQYVPAYFKAIEFNDFIHGETKFAASSRKTSDALRTSITEKARELNIPIKPKDIRITRRGPAFKLELDYSFPIDLRVYQHDLKFHVSEAGEIFENDRR
jgi:hypothetical protein